MANTLEGLKPSTLSGISVKEVSKGYFTGPVRKNVVDACTFDSIRHAANR